ncbi:hypothetical protein ACFL3D_03850 [Candidatus Omnitrophota bacterium]
MDRKKVEIIIAVGLILIFFVIILKPKKRGSKGAVKYTVEEVKGVEDVLHSINLIKSNKINLDSIQSIEELRTEQVAGRNPFDILVKTNVIEPEPEIEEPEEMVEDVGPFPDIEIQGVVFAQHNPADSVVIINNEELKIGDRIKEWEIILVQDQVVQFKKENTVHEINLYENS